MRRLAIRSALSDKVANEQLIVMDRVSLDQPRTRDMLDLLDNLPVNGKKTLFVLPQRDENIVLSTRNIPNAKVQHVSSINVIELLKHDFVILPLTTVKWLELVFGDGLSADEATEQVAAQIAESATVADEEADAAVSAEETSTETAAEGEEE